MWYLFRKYDNFRNVVKESSLARNISLFCNNMMAVINFLLQKSFFTLLNIILTDGRTFSIIDISCTWICSTSKLFFYYHKCPQENCGSIKQRVWLHPTSFKQDSIFIYKCLPQDKKVMQKAATSVFLPRDMIF